MSEKTVNGIELLSEISGLSQSDIRSMWEQGKDNLRRIDSCKGHKFSPTGTRGRLKCSVCGGEVDAREARLYEQGLAHGRGQALGVEG